MVKRNKDRNAWLTEQVSIIESENWDGLDANGLMEELMEMARSDKSAMRSQLTRLLTHLLKWEKFPDGRTTSWVASIESARLEIEILLKDNPSLKRFLEEIINDKSVYQRAVRWASSETTIPERQFPKTNPFSYQEIMSNKLKLKAKNLK